MSLYMCIYVYDLNLRNCKAVSVSLSAVFPSGAGAVKPLGQAVGKGR